MKKFCIIYAEVKIEQEQWGGKKGNKSSWVHNDEQRVFFKPWFEYGQLTGAETEL